MKSSNDTITVERKKLEGVLHLIDRVGELSSLNRVELAADRIIEILNPTLTLTEADWERVIDEGFYVTRSQTRELYLLDHIPVCNNVVVAREKGIRQPHFHGHPHPEGEQRVIAVYDNGTRDYSASWDIAWGSVKEYILL